MRSGKNIANLRDYIYGSLFSHRFAICSFTITEKGVKGRALKVRSGCVLGYLDVGFMPERSVEWMSDE